MSTVKVPLLGDGLPQVRFALTALQKRMERDAKLKLEYTEFMDEYLRLGHMRLLSHEELSAVKSPVCYLPHHGVWQRNDNGLRLRVVFNASRATSSGYSLNDALYAGPKLQNDLALVVTRWRMHRVAFCADIKMMIIQDLWRAKFDWDTPNPEPWLTKWRKFRETMRQVDVLSLPRWIRSGRAKSTELHAFADASRRAIAATVYSRVTDAEGMTTVNLLMAKTSMAPIKGLQPQAHVTIPRLELRAALLTARLLCLLAKSLSIPLGSCNLWSDSQIVLHWLQTDGPTGHDFVDSCISHVQELTSEAAWRHVPSADNPVDLATRGVSTATLGESRLWWRGPAWLATPVRNWPVPAHLPANATTVNEDDTSLACCVLHTPTSESSLLERFSDLDCLLRALVRCKRLFRRRTEREYAHPMSPVTVEELKWAFSCCARLSQEQDLSAELKCLRWGLSLNCYSHLRTLAPQLDELDVFRVGGRLQHSLLSHDQKHPVILDGKGRLAKLLIAWAHSRSLHGGFRATYFRVLQRAWIIGGRRAIRKHVTNCVVCAKVNARPLCQEMAKLPEARVTPSRPFSRCGVDYAEPFSILRTRGRGLSTFKGYIALFVCLSTKAIHLELAGHLTTESFLGALARFRGRRGPPAEIWSDNGTNFRGASGELLRMLRDAALDWGKVEGELAKEGVTCRFIPPGSPHFGGIWEFNIMSVKAHLRRVLGSRKFVYEEFYTLLVEVEAVLNCRPLAPLSGDPDDVDVLTPGHFLVGETLTSAPRPSRGRENLDHLSHWRLIEALRDQFWLRWSKQYLHTLQQRQKWTDPKANLAVGDLVTILDPSLIRADGKWPMGRVIHIHPGDDGRVRVADVRAHSGTYRRPVVKLARLPVVTSPSSQSESLPVV